jgi:uncharacterized protein (DUF2235 family)
LRRAYGAGSIVDPAKQVAFYVPGISKPKPFHNSWMDRVADNVQQVFGFGLTRKIIDCYMAIVSVWQPGDCIYLFGFSRGAYTARCAARALDVCGQTRSRAATATISIRPFCAGRPKQPSAAFMCSACPIPTPRAMAPRHIDISQTRS